MRRWDGTILSDRAEEASSRLDEPVADGLELTANRTSGRGRWGQETDLPPAVDTGDSPACSKAQMPKGLGPKEVGHAKRRTGFGCAPYRVLRSEGRQGGGPWGGAKLLAARVPARSEVGGCRGGI